MIEGRLMWMTKSPRVEILAIQVPIDVRTGISEVLPATLLVRHHAGRLAGMHLPDCDRKPPCSGISSPLFEP